VTPKPVEETIPFKEIVEKLEVEESQSGAYDLVKLYFQSSGEERSSEKSLEIINHLVRKSMLSNDIPKRDFGRVVKLVKDVDPEGLDSLKKATSDNVALQNIIRNSTANKIPKDVTSLRPVLDKIDSLSAEERQNFALSIQDTARLFKSSDENEKSRLVEACTSAGGLPSLLPDVAKVSYNAQDVSTLKKLKAALGPEAWSQLKTMHASLRSKPSGDVEVISQMLEVSEGNEVAVTDSHNIMLTTKDKVEGRGAAEKYLREVMMEKVTLFDNYTNANLKLVQEIMPEQKDANSLTAGEALVQREGRKK